MYSSIISFMGKKGAFLMPELGKDVYEDGSLEAICFWSRMTSGSMLH
ncbi:hypothetical protein ACEQPO_19800 [Bacillus sp. SL00103]